MLVFDVIGTMHTRYLEALSPALAIAIGWAAVTLAGLFDWRGRRGSPALRAIVVALVLVCIYEGGLRPDSIGSGAGGADRSRPSARRA